MCNRSHTQVKEFILFGFLSSQHLQVFLFVFFRSVYVLTVMGNLCIIVFVSTHHPRHHPMYYFPCNFAFLEIWFTTACIPKTLANLVSQSQSISFTGCLLQMYFVFSFGCTEYFFLAAMAYDRYLAVCYPLSYSTIMTSTLSRGLAVGSWVGGFLVISVPAPLTSRLSFCGSNIINYFFCDISPWITLSCTDITLVELVCFVLFAIVILGSCVITLIAYISIISTVLRIPSAQGWQRSFSTFSSHLIVVIIWYCFTIFLHVKPSIKAPLELKGMRKSCLYKQTGPDGR
ncbi:PREDICTED: LOW QUALITY PROTEIN: olfactory receptor 6F1-like [Corvus brachyrhynchos]|uniref:LOW QUALITY PROTEIN: olfactory receptor 6F1-like n=1 Tax=Corvus brachyrhynchos TaxID=85066 RepID=UPI00081679F4|nr:PREDICTED: LOW QUALITY PROTEIN: olfactory receptor 6F1-like [Corvus brachyrhynchos]